MKKRISPSVGFNKEISSLSKFLAAAALIHGTLINKPIREHSLNVVENIRATLNPDFKTHKKFQELQGLRQKDPEKEKQLKQELVSRLEQNLPISLQYVTFQAERFGLGMTPLEERSAQNVVAELLNELNKEKPHPPTRDFLQKIRDTGLKAGGADAALSLSSVIRYFNRQNSLRRGDCNAFSISTAILLQKLYPEREDDIFFQIFDGELTGHRRVLFRIKEENKIYVLDNNYQEVFEIDPKELEGTAIFSIRDHIAMYAGDSRFIKPIHTGSNEEPNIRPGFNPDSNIENEQIFFSPPIEGKLKDYPLSNTENEKKQWQKEAAFLAQDIEEEKKALAASENYLDTFEVKVFEHSSGKLYHYYEDWAGSPQKMHQYLVEAEEEALGKNETEIVLSVPYICPASAIHIINQWKGKLPLWISYSGNISYFSHEALQELARSNMERLSLVTDYSYLPPGFVNNLKDLNILTLDILTQKNHNNYLDPSTLKKLFSSQFNHQKPSIRLGDLKLNDEEAKIIAQSRNYKYIFLYSKETSELYSNSILEIFSTSNVLVSIQTSAEKMKAYSAQSPWLNIKNMPGISSQPILMKGSVVVMVD